MEESTGASTLLLLDRAQVEEMQNGTLSLLRISLKPRVLGIEILDATFYCWTEAARNHFGAFQNAHKISPRMVNLRKSQALPR